MNEQKYGVFRFYDAKQKFLYVSVSQRNLAKEIAHLSKYEWINSADLGRTNITWYDSEDEANVAANAAIKTEKPLHNKQVGTVRKTTDLPAETQTALRRRLDSGADELGVPTLTFQRYNVELLTLAIDDDTVHKHVIDRLRAKTI